MPPFVPPTHGCQGPLCDVSLPDVSKMSAFDVLDFVPVVGTVARLGQGLVEDINGNGAEARKHYAMGGVNLGMDLINVATLGVGGTGARVASGMGARVATKVGVEVAAHAAEEGVEHGALKGAGVAISAASLAAEVHEDEAAHNDETHVTLPHDVQQHSDEPTLDIFIVPSVGAVVVALLPTGNRVFWGGLSFATLMGLQYILERQQHGKHI